MPTTGPEPAGLANVLESRLRAYSLASDCSIDRLTEGLCVGFLSRFARSSEDIPNNNVVVWTWKV